MNIEELKKKESYEFECNISDEYKNLYTDEWGSAFVWLGDYIGAEYNFCVEDEETNSCAIYKMELDKETDYMITHHDIFNHYEVDFDNPNWEEELENAMCKALIEFHKV